MSLSIVTHRSGAMSRLDVTGEIDMDTAAVLDQAIAAVLTAGTDNIVVDLRAVTFCDCRGVTALLQGRGEALEHNVTYQVTNPVGSPLRVLQLLGLQSLLATPDAEW
jgi:anti-anti-sigma factor